MKPVTYETLISEAKIQERIKELASAIDRDLNGEELIVIGVMKGAFIFAADLIRRLSMPIRMEFIGVASYAGTESTGEVRITHDLTAEVRGKNVLLVEDIIDTGRTIDYLLDVINIREPKTLRICSFLSKPTAHVMRHHIDYVGFTIANEFVVGYGLDLDGYYRQLPYLARVTVTG